MTKILVSVNKSDKAVEVLRYSVKLAAAMNADVHVYKPSFDSVYELNRYIGFDNYDELEKQVVELDRQWLDSVLAQVDFGSVAVSSCVEWCKLTYQGIVEQAQTEACDLIIKAADVHHRLTEIIRTPSEWHLLRDTDCPVLLLRTDGDSFYQQIVVAAVSPLEDDKQHFELHQRVLLQARAFADALGAKFMAVGAIPIVTSSLPYAIDISLQYPELQQDLLQRAKTALRELIDKLKISADEVLIERGMPEDVLHGVCERNSPSLLVIGTVANKGLMKVMLGNTSERVVYHVDQSMLVVP